MTDGARWVRCSRCWYFNRECPDCKLKRLESEVERLREAIALVRPDPGLSFASQKVLDGALRGEEGERCGGRGKRGDGFVGLKHDPRTSCPGCPDCREEPCFRCKGSGEVVEVRPYNPNLDIASHPNAELTGIKTAKPCPDCEEE